MADFAKSISAVCGFLCFFNTAVIGQNPIDDSAPQYHPPGHVHIRLNQVGYLPEDAKEALIFSRKPIQGSCSILQLPDMTVAYTAQLRSAAIAEWGGFPYHFLADFREARSPGRYVIRVDSTSDRSHEFCIGPEVYGDYHEDLLKFMRQQRCGYNPFLDVVCHQHDGRTAYGPLPAGSYVDVRGGWHDAGDQLKYLITGSNATARMLLAYQLEPHKFVDAFDAMGRPRSNAIPDVLDEAKWGLDWMLKLHPEPDQLYHQVADDRDHTGWKLPNEDDSDYGWGKNSYRVVYAATGRPQGLSRHPSEATGIANLAGRFAAAMAMAHNVWKYDLQDVPYAETCLRAGIEVYEMGRAAEGFQQGNSYKAPYRYLEKTWADDMEWGAAELYKATGNRQYLEQAKDFAGRIANTSWMEHESVGHYEYYPFVNVGHFALFPLVEPEFQQRLARYYRAGIEASIVRSQSNPYRTGAPFIWCSNNLTTALATQILLYERMTGDVQFHDFMLAQRDWLLGRNPWGTSMFTGIPRGGQGKSPEDIHTSIWKLTRRSVPGGLVDGPVKKSIFDGLMGIQLTRPDPFAEYQSEAAVYHDDIGDYSTNEPTMDGTADAILLMASFGVESTGRTEARDSVTRVENGIVRGRTDCRQLALLFTGDEFMEGTQSILEVLRNHGVKASFFLTGNFLAQTQASHLVTQMIQDSHYVGPHSHGHLLYADWNDRQRSLVSEREFKSDLERNLADLRKRNVQLASPFFFVPPYEWYNAQHADWSSDMNCQLISFTAGSGSHRDFAPEDHAAFVSSNTLIEQIISHERTQPLGLNGHLLLLHLGSARLEKVHGHLERLILALQARGYQFRRVDELLDEPSKIE